MENPIYSKIDYEQVISAKKEFLESQANLLRALKYAENYRTLRKRELLLKMDLRKKVVNVGTKIKEILKSVPKTEGIREIEKDYRKKRSEKNKTQDKSTLSIEAELEDIQRRLQELS